MHMGIHKSFQPKTFKKRKKRKSWKSNTAQYFESLSQLSSKTGISETPGKRRMEFSVLERL